MHLNYNGRRNKRKSILSNSYHFLSYYYMLQVHAKALYKYV